VTDEDAETARESQDEVDTILAETGATMHKVRRWRREGLLSKEIDWSPGRAVRYPRGTCAQIRALTVLFKEKDRLDYVGFRLWVYGFPVDEKYWRPRLSRAGRVADKAARLLPGFVDRFDRPSNTSTFFETVAGKLSQANNIVSSRIKGRVSVDRLPAFVQVMEEVGRGDFVDFGHVVADEERVSGRATTIDALDLKRSGSDLILGQKLNLLELLPSGLAELSTAISRGRFEDIADAPAHEIAKARDDARNGVLIGFYLYESNRWIYGDGSFGLRLIAWIARKAPDSMIDGMTLLMFRLRQIPNAILPSNEIAELARKARELWIESRRLEWLWRNDQRFSKILDPKRMRTAFADEIALKRWKRELNTIIVQARGKPPTGSIDDGQEVGKSH
jgi:hypothetical protein